ncbi:hypothetical protein NEOC65_000013 [Neochlamydia sp. AcF65]|uniref:hypothetical protein n=1 Tax=unclassified Neochlamydia TaxID=2643326 RepID=UPI001409C7D3|nr:MULTISPECIES: hypothetical protein [unclassified Neochlamydia]MBS4164967.1 hypothetical protein [Neochlamydia sp. AcF65]NGY94337.1 hypothetical protein [Neochlamydia sp. AcF84]
MHQAAKERKKRLWRWCLRDRPAFCRSSYVEGIDPLVPPRREGRLKPRDGQVRGEEEKWSSKSLKGFGGDFRFRKLAYQRAELHVKSLAINKSTKRRMPKGQ